MADALPGLHTGGGSRKPLTKKEKQALAIAGGVTLAGVVVGVVVMRRPKKDTGPKAPPKPKGLIVNANCNEYSVENEGVVRDDIRKQLDKAEKQGAVSPFQVASSYLSTVTKCRVYPETSRNPGEAGLYVLAFGWVLDEMRNQNLISASEEDMYKQMVKTWGLEQGLEERDF